jgi:hypothetical protein
MKSRHSIIRQWQWPSTLAILTIFGLLSALLGQSGVWLWLSWTALTIPLATIILCLVRPPARPDAKGNGTSE